MQLLVGHGVAVDVRVYRGLKQRVAVFDDDVVDDLADAWIADDGELELIELPVAVRIGERYDGMRLQRVDDERDGIDRSSRAGLLRTQRNCEHHAEQECHHSHGGNDSSGVFDDTP